MTETVLLFLRHQHPDNNHFRKGQGRRPSRKKKHIGTISTHPLPIVTLTQGTLTQSLDDIQHPFDAPTLTYLQKWYKIAWAFFVFILFVTWVV